MRIALIGLVLGACYSDYGSECGTRDLTSCGPGLVCDIQSDSETGRCRCASIDADIEIGGGCKDPSACRSCRMGLRCSDATDRCTAPNSMPEGGPCAEDIECVAGTICNRAIERCVLPASHAIDEPCGRTLECMTGLVCIGRKCAEPRGVGEQCTDDWCRPDLVCGAPLDPTHCQEVGDVGSLCETAAHCRAPLVCNGWFDPPQCGTGDWFEPCLDNDDCAAPRFCANNVCV